MVKCHRKIIITDSIFVQQRIVPYVFAYKSVVVAIIAVYCIHIVHYKQIKYVF